MLNHITDDELRKLYVHDGKSGKEIAAMFGVSPATVCARMKKAGIKARSPHDYPPTQKQRDAWHRNGINLFQKHPMSHETAVARGKLNRGKRRRDDYEFGGHEKKRTDGYIKVYVPDHPNATADGYVMKHTLVMEKAVGRFLKADEVVHHINRVRDDNRLENLLLMTKQEHMALHMRERNAKRRSEKC